MRIALLSMLEPAGFGNEPLRAFLNVGGSSIARHQLALVMALGCQKIICLARNLTPELVNLQHEIERAGARFHCVNSSVALGGLITATDEVVVVTDGLVLPLHLIDTVAPGTSFVLVQPVEVGIAAGFERIDSSYATAGLMRIPGRLVERLSELPSDCDVVSALTRIALQAGISQRQVHGNQSQGSSVNLIRDQATAISFETQWFRLLLGTSEHASPGTWLARWCVKEIGPGVLAASRGWNGGSNSAYLVFIVLLLLSHLAGWFAFGATAFALCAIGWFLGQGAGIVRRIERDSLMLPQDRLSLAEVMNWLVDFTFISIFAWVQLDHTPLPTWYRLFVPFMLVATIRLVARIFEGSGRQIWSGWIEDRAMLLLIFAILTAAGLVPQVAAGLACLYAAIALVWPLARKIA